MPCDFDSVYCYIYPKKNSVSEIVIMKFGMKCPEWHIHEIFQCQKYLDAGGEGGGYGMRRLVIVTVQICSVRQ